MQTPLGECSEIVFLEDFQKTTPGLEALFAHYRLYHITTTQKQGYKIIILRKITMFENEMKWMGF